MKQKERHLKCVVWDLDNTLWDGVLLDGDPVTVRDSARLALEVLDQRGILHSIASRNDHQVAMAKLAEASLDRYFLYPQINWGLKTASIRAIAESLRISLDAIAFIDDDPFELDQVMADLPEVVCLPAADVERLVHMPELLPTFLTDEARFRRQMYVSEKERQGAEETFAGPKEEFLASLAMKFTIASAGPDDLPRAAELTLRTNQLNTTGCAYSLEELDQFRNSPRHYLLIGKLEDRYGSYGTVGLALVECAPGAWIIKLLLMSCRVMSRGVGGIMLNEITRMAHVERVRLLAEFRPNGRNRMMLVTYRFAGFQEAGEASGVMLLEHPLTHVPPPPPYVEVQCTCVS